MPKTANRTIIAVDIDDVLANSTDAIRVFVNQRRGIDLTEEHWRIEGEYWGYYEGVFRQHGVDPTGLLDDFHNGLHIDQSSIRPIDNSVESIKKLDKKYNLIPVTSRPEAMKEETLRWLNLHFNKIFSTDPIFIGFKTDAKRSKGEACAAIGASYLIDDNVEHCESALEHDVQAVLFGDYGWHQKLPEKVVRCKNWQEVLEYFENESR